MRGVGSGLTTYYGCLLHFASRCCTLARERPNEKWMKPFPSLSRYHLDYWSRASLNALRLERKASGNMLPICWRPPIELSTQEQTIIAQIRRGKVFVFLRLYRHEVFDED